MCFFCTLLNTVNAQNYTLRILAKDHNNNALVESISYRKTPVSKKNAFREIEVVSKKLALQGFINNQYQVAEKDSILYCTYILGNKTEQIKVFYKHKLLSKILLQKISSQFTDTYFIIPPQKIESTLHTLVAFFENNGHSFTNLSLTHLQQEGHIINAQLNLHVPKKRTFNNFIVEGYSKFPKKHLKHYLKLKKENLFNLRNLKFITQRANNIPFTTQFKKPATLFSKDSTQIYLYLKKKATSNFDGIIGFESKNKHLKFTGYLNLNLHNIFNKGENLELKWKNSGGKNQSLNISVFTPYIFNSVFSTQGNFSIFKQDSSYTTTKSQLKIDFNTNNSTLHTVVNSEISTVTLANNNTENNFENYKKTFLGFGYTYKKPLFSSNSNTQTFFVSFEYLTGKSNNNNTSRAQHKTHFLGEYIFNFNSKNTVYLKNNSAVLNISNLLQNELFAIGGYNSIRGFNEQSILTSKYSITNIEYHINIQSNTKIYSVTDVAWLKDSFTNNTTNLISVGLGYYFTNHKRTINISYVVGRYGQSTFNLNQAKVHLKISYAL